MGFLGGLGGLTGILKPLDVFKGKTSASPGMMAPSGQISSKFPGSRLREKAKSEISGAEQEPEQAAMQKTPKQPEKNPPHQMGAVGGILDTQSPVPIPSFTGIGDMSQDQLIRLLQAALWGAL